MSGDLRERLADLADDAPRSVRGLGPSYDELWRRGRRRRRGEQLVAGVAVLVVLAGLGSLLGLAAVGRGAPQPAGPGGRVGLPDRFYGPSPWLPGTTGDPRGPLVAIYGAERRSAHGLTEVSVNGIVAVSAETGDYRFLDLPGAAAGDSDMVGGDGPSLSPDGRWVAYWLGGRVRNDAGRSVVAPTGFAVLDTRTGRVWRHPIAGADQGVHGGAVAWTPGRVWFGYGLIDSLRSDGSSARYGATSSVLDLATGAVTQSTDLRPQARPTSGTGGFLIGERRLVQVTAPGETTLVGRLDRAVTRPFLSPRGAYLAALPVEPQDMDRRLLVAKISGPGTDVTLRAVPGVRASDVFGWRDERHVVVRDQLGEVRSVDVLTGRASRLSTFRGLVPWSPFPTLATALLDAPTVPGRRPPGVLDPRVRVALTVLSGVGGAVVLVGAALRTRRRRADA